VRRIRLDVGILEFDPSHEWQKDGNPPRSKVSISAIIDETITGMPHGTVSACLVHDDWWWWLLKIAT
jgi:hypothetical protein